MATSTHTPPDGPGHPSPVSDESLRRGHEVSDANVRAVVNFMIWLTVGIVVIAVGVFYAERYFSARNSATDRRESPWAGVREPSPEPRLQPSVDHPTMPFDDMVALQQKWDAELKSYARVEGSDDLVSIPIQRAMALVAQRGIEKVRPAKRPATGPATGGGK